MKSKEKQLLTQLQLLKHKRKRWRKKVYDESINLNLPKRKEKWFLIITTSDKIVDDNLENLKWNKMFPFTLSLKNLRMILFAVFYETFSIKSKNVCNVILTIIYDWT